jgi:hypothetical protein
VRSVPLLIGAVLALAVGVLGTTTRMDRDRAFYALVTMVVASYYVLFAVLGQSTRALGIETAIAMLFVLAAVGGFKRTMWIVAAALAGHGAMDFVHGAFVQNPGVPLWWPPFCAGYDLAAGAYLAWLIRSGRVRASA